MPWDIKRETVFGNIVVVEWYFKCDYKDNMDGFDKGTKAEFDFVMKICDGNSVEGKVIISVGRIMHKGLIIEK